MEVKQESLREGWVSPYIEESIRLLSIFETQLNQIFLGPWLSQILYVTYDGNMAKGKNAHLASAGRARGRGRANGRKGRAADAQNRRGLLVTTDDTSIWPESVVSGDVQPLHARTDDDGVGKDEDDKEQNTPGPSDPPSPLTSLATDVAITVPVAMWVSSRRRRLYLPHLMLFSAQDFDQCDPRRCSGKRLARQHIITELRIGSRFRGIVLSSVFFLYACALSMTVSPEVRPKAIQVLSPADKDIIDKGGLAVVECSWARLSEIPFSKIASPHERLRASSYTSSTNPP